MENCTLCPRACGVNRSQGKTGYCHSTATLKVARAALHPWEEPCISVGNGSGTVFFSGCNLGCVYCQNREIATGEAGKEITVNRLAEIFLELQKQGAANINLVTPTHYSPQIKEGLVLAKKQGLALPIAYNCGGYEAVRTLRELEGFIDIYLTDFKYMDSVLSEAYSSAADYPQVAKAALAEMVRQQPQPILENGVMKAGVLVRHLLLPGELLNGKAVVRYLYETYGNQIYISLMNQYTPHGDLTQFPKLQQKVTKKAYNKLVGFALDLGVEQAFIQEGDTASESFIPPFLNQGV
jgi:putative pyruvate formate lyase activating enzyme